MLYIIIYSALLIVSKGTPLTDTTDEESDLKQSQLNDGNLDKSIEALVSKAYTILHLIQHDCNCKENSNDLRFMSTICTPKPADSKHSSTTATVSSEMMIDPKLNVLSDNLEKISHLLNQKSTVNLKKNSKNKFSNRRKIFRDIKKSYFPGAFL